MAAASAFLFILIFFLPETLPQQKRSKEPMINSFKSYFVLIKDAKFMKYTLSITFFYIAAYAFITGSSFVYIDYFGIPSKYYGFLFGVNILGVAALSFLNKSLVNKFSLNSLLITSSTVAFVAAALLLALTFFGIAGV